MSNQSRRGRSPAQVRNKGAVLRSVPTGYKPPRDVKINSHGVRCPQCGAEEEENCIREDGTLYPRGSVHPRRRRMAVRARNQAKAKPWSFSPEVISKARSYLAEGRVSRDEEVSSVWWVTGSDPRRSYRVQSDADPEARTASWINCTCPHGLNVGAGTATCSHAVAVLLTILEDPPETGV